jgi:hypothetical protein
VAHPRDAVFWKSPMTSAICPIDGLATGVSSDDLRDAQPIRTWNGGPRSPLIPWDTAMRSPVDLLDPIP